MEKLLREWRKQLAALKTEAKTLFDKASAESRGLNDDEKARDDEIAAEMETLAADIARGERQLEREREAIAADAGGEDESGRVRVTDNRIAPFANFGEQLQAIAQAGMAGGRVDERLLELNAAASGSSAGVPSDGGYLIQPEFSQDIMQRAYETGQLASRCDRIQITMGDALEVPYIDETSRTNGNRWGGVQVYRAAEAAAVTASNVKIGKMETRVEDLKGLAYMTERLLEDAPAMQQVMGDAFVKEMAFKIDDEIFDGEGNGECLGFMKSNALVTVAKESGQTADTIVAANVVKMYARMWARSRFNSVWLINQDCEEQLPLMTLGDQPIYLPPGGLSEMPYGRLLGRPVIPIEHAETLGDKGDINLVDLSQYALVSKGGVKAASSMHVRFIYDEMTFKWSTRVNGQPKWKRALTPYKGTKTQSPFITLAARA